MAKKYYFIIFTIFTYIVMFNGPAQAGAYDGSWHDNAGMGERIGNMVVTSSVIKVGRTRYNIANSKGFNKGEAFLVSPVLKMVDPHGCGAGGKVTYIIIEPVPDVSGLPKSSITVTFYAGATWPDPQTIGNSKDVCESHPYGRSR